MTSPDPLKYCLAFDLAEESCVSLEGKTYPVFMDPAGLDVLRTIATGIVRKGFSASKVKPAKGIEAGFLCRLSGTCEIDVLLGVERKKKGYVSCHLFTWWFPAFPGRLFRREEKPPEECISQWIRLCGAIKDVTVEALGATSVEWLTQDEMNAREAAEQKTE
jgi:hypothetical protein